MQSTSESNLEELKFSLISTSCSYGWSRFCHRVCIYLFPVCALTVALILVGFAFKSPRPGVSLGFSFFLLILAILYCVIGNVVRYWLSESEHDQRDNESGIYESKESIMMISSL